MTTEQAMNSVNKTARLTGALYLLELPLGIFGVVYPSSLVAPGDVATTANNIMASETLFRLSIVSALILHVVGIFVVLLLYKLLKPVDENIALFMVIFLLVAVPIAMLNEINRFAVLLFVNSADSLTVFTADQLQSLVPLFLDLHEHGIGITTIFYGLWLFPMGYLVFRSGFLPRILGVLLMIGGFGYLITFLNFSLFPNFDATISNFTWLGELAFPLWLLIKGVNVERWIKRSLSLDRE
jgi:hypothetical protein